MADFTIGRALSGLGAAFKNEVPAFLQQVRQEDLDAEKRAEREMFLADRSFDRGIAAEDRAMRLEDRNIAMERAGSDRVFELEEKRKETLFKDTAEAKRYLQDGNIMAIIDLYTDRVNLLRNMGIDTSNSERMLSFAQGALSDPNALARLNDEINTVYDTGRAFNVGMVEMPSAYRSLDLQAQAAGFSPGSAGYQRFMRFGGGSADEGAAKTEFFDNGAVLEKPRNGPPKLFVNGQQITDPKEYVIQMDLAVASGPLLAQETAIATTRGGAEEGRAQEYIIKGQSAADSTAVIRRSLALLEKVETGGLGRTTMLAAKRMFGVEGADEGELSASLGKAVLAQLRETFGAAFTAQEGESLKEIEAGFGSSVAANTRLLNNSLRIAQRAAERGIRAAESRDDYESASEIEMALDFDLGVFESEYSSFGESVPPFPSAFADVLTEEDWANMNEAERSAFQ